MKFVVVILILVAVYLFYPFRTLYVKTNPFDGEYLPVQEGFWTLDACTETARAIKAEYYRCRKTTAWSSLFTTYRQYGREAETQ